METGLEELESLDIELDELAGLSEIEELPKEKAMGCPHCKKKRPSSIVYCPYCGKGQEIIHDDGYGYDEDKVYEQECDDCDKIFSFTTSIHFYYEASKAPCLNGGDHVFQKFARFSGRGREDWERCIHCERERRVT